MIHSDNPPSSASSFLINLIGGVCYLLSLFITLNFFPHLSILTHAVISIMAAIIPILLGEIFVLKVYKRASVGLQQNLTPNAKRFKTKLLGFYVTFILVFFWYALITMHYGLDGFDGFLQDFFFLLLLSVLPIVVLGWLYIEETDNRLKDPYDGLWQFGCLLSGQWKEISSKVIFSYLKSVVLRAYFIPVMLASFLYTVGGIINFDTNTVAQFADNLENIPGYELFKILFIGYLFLSAMDSLFAVIGYIMAFKILDTNIRSVEPRLLGWVVCLICYFPFFGVLMANMVLYELYNGPRWYDWFAGHSTFLLVWGVLTVLAMCAEAVTTVTFGLRFSNLTYRGLISTGPFRLTKHPQYVFKLLNRFLVFVPFLSLGGVLGALYTMLLFCVLCLIYYLRAKTEENHLSRYPEYVEYAHWIERHGIFRFMGRFLPFLRYSKEKATAGKLFCSKF